MADNTVFIVQYTNEKSCFVRTDPSHWKKSHIKSENLADYDVIKVTTEDLQSSYFGLSPISTKTPKNDGLYLNGICASKLGIKNGEKVSAELLKNVSVCVCAWIEPLSVDDWEILEINAQEVEGSLLDQVRVLWAGQVFPLWVSGNICIFLKTVAIEPASQCGILMPLTELVIEPKIAKIKEFDFDDEDVKNEPKASSSSKKWNSENKKYPPPQVQQQEEKQEVLNIPEPSEGSLSEPIQSPNAGLIQRILRLSILRRFCQMVSYICGILWHRVVPFILGPFSVFKAVPKALAVKVENMDLNEKVMSRITDCPQKFNLVLRVESTHIGDSSPLAKFDQAGFAMLNSPNKCTCESPSRGGRKICTCSNDDVDFGIFYVALEKLPRMKNVGDNSSLPQPLDGANTREAVVRLCIQSMSTFEMFFRDDDENFSEFVQSLSISDVLRMQLGIGLCSKVCLKKLKSLPKPAKENIKKITLRAVDGLPHGLTMDDITISFRRWIPHVCDEDNPVPIVQGSIFCIPVRKFLTVKESSPCFHADETKILISVEKIFSFDDKEKSGYYLLSPRDVSLMEIDFIPNPVQNLKTLSEIDPKIPQESLEGLIQSQKTVIFDCLNHVESVFRSTPIVSKLNGKKLVHPGFILLTGASGMGKTHLGNVLLRKLAIVDRKQAYVRWISCAKLKGKKLETIKKMLLGLKCELEWKQPSILLLDDIDQLVPANASPEGDSSPSAVYALQLAVILKEILSGICHTSYNRIHKVCIIATALSEQAIHPVLMPAQGCHIFARHLILNLPENKDRQEFLKAVIMGDLAVNPKCVHSIDFDSISAQTEGFSVKDFVQVTKRAVVNAKNRFTTGSMVSLKNVDFENALRGYTPISLQDANLHKPKKFSWSDVGGLKNIRKQLKEKLVWPMKYADLYQSTGMQLRSGVLLYGPPGCGKTLLAGVVANECNLNFISVKGPELLSKYIGASEAAVRDLFNRASAAAPCILFFDEFDSVAQKRGHDSTGVTDRVVNQILTHLDGVEPLSGVYVLAATSRPDLIDPALLRPGRLDTHLHCPMPDFEERCDILNCLIQKLSLSDEVNVRSIAARCEHFTGADLKALVYDAQLNALHSHAESAKNPPGKDDSQSSTSMSSSSIEMEIDDQYNSNGFGSILSEMKDENDVSIPDPENLVKKFTQTAAELAKSIQDQYKLCYGLSPPDNSLKSSSGTFSPEKTSSKLIYFPSLYSKTEETSAIPESVQLLVNSVSSFDNDLCEEENFRTDSKSNVIKVGSYDFETVLESAAPSVSTQERQRYAMICSNFSGKKDPDAELRIWDMRKQQRATLA